MSEKPLFETDLRTFKVQVQKAGARRQTAVNILEIRTAELRGVALAAVAAGVPEREVARLAEVSIPTLRKWQGKK